MIPTDAKERKNVPIATGFVDYFPDAISSVAELSRIGNDQHNPGKPLHWDRSKSGDEADALMRHFVERGTIDTDGVRHSTKVAWRALALLQKEIENERASIEVTTEPVTDIVSGELHSDGRGNGKRPERANAATNLDQRARNRDTAGGPGTGGFGK